MNTVNRNLIAFGLLVGGWLISHPALSQTTTYYRDYMGRQIGSAYTPPPVTGPYGYHGETPYTNSQDYHTSTPSSSGLSDVLRTPTPYMPY